MRQLYDQLASFAATASYSATLNMARGDRRVIGTVGVRSPDSIRMIDSYCVQWAQSAAGEALSSGSLVAPYCSPSVHS